jgi:CBS domain containing-hemolysin-like protein
MEAVLLSTTKSFLMVKEEQNIRWATKFLNFKKDIDKPLSAILSLNTVAHTVGAAGVGAQASIVFGSEYFGIVSAVLTLLILIFTEIIPKTLGANYWDKLAAIITYFISGSIIITYPLVKISSLLTKLFASKEAGKSTSREEIALLAGIGADEGLFDIKEQKVIQNILKLKSLKVSSIMTPRTVLATASGSMSITDFKKSILYRPFSRIPIYKEDIDDTDAYIVKQEVYECEQPENKTLENFGRKMLIVPAAKTVFDLWELLLKQKEHIALVIDEFGGVDGIVTMEDIIESILGLEIIDEKDMADDMQKLALERWNARQKKYKFIDKD